VKLAPLALLLAACASFHQGPFIPVHATRCACDADCNEHQVCRFPEPGSRALCMPGTNSIDAWPHQ
jgi:hypothetical protein